MTQTPEHRTIHFIAQAHLITPLGATIKTAPSGQQSVLQLPGSGEQARNLTAHAFLGAPEDETDPQMDLEWDRVTFETLGAFTTVTVRGTVTGPDVVIRPGASGAPESHAPSGPLSITLRLADMDSDEAVTPELPLTQHANFFTPVCTEAGGQHLALLAVYDEGGDGLYLASPEVFPHYPEAVYEAYSRLLDNIEIDLQAGDSEDEGSNTAAQAAREFTEEMLSANGRPFEVSARADGPAGKLEWRVAVQSL